MTRHCAIIVATAPTALTVQLTAVFQTPTVNFVTTVSPTSIIALVPFTISRLCPRLRFAFATLLLLCPILANVLLPLSFAALISATER